MRDPFLATWRRLRFASSRVTRRLFKNWELRIWRFYVSAWQAVLRPLRGAGKEFGLENIVIAISFAVITAALSSILFRDALLINDYFDSVPWHAICITLVVIGSFVLLGPFLYTLGVVIGLILILGAQTLLPAVLGLFALLVGLVSCRVIARVKLGRKWAAVVTSSAPALMIVMGTYIALILALGKVSTSLLVEVLLRLRAFHEGLDTYGLYVRSFFTTSIVALAVLSYRHDSVQISARWWRVISVSKSSIGHASTVALAASMIALGAPTPLSNTGDIELVRTFHAQKTAARETLQREDHDKPLTATRADGSVLQTEEQHIQHRLLALLLPQTSRNSRLSASVVPLEMAMEDDLLNRFSLKPDDASITVNRPPPISNSFERWLRRTFSALPRGERQELTNSARSALSTRLSLQKALIDEVLSTDNIGKLVTVDSLPPFAATLFGNSASEITSELRNQFVDTALKADFLDRISSLAAKTQDKHTYLNGVVAHRPGPRMLAYVNAAKPLPQDQATAILNAFLNDQRLLRNYDKLQSEVGSQNGRSPFSWGAVDDAFKPVEEAFRAMEDVNERSGFGDVLEKVGHEAPKI